MPLYSLDSASARGCCATLLRDRAEKACDGALRGAFVSAHAVPRHAFVGSRIADLGGARHREVHRRTVHRVVRLPPGVARLHERDPRPVQGVRRRLRRADAEQGAGRSGRRSKTKRSSRAWQAPSAPSTRGSARGTRAGASPGPPCRAWRRSGRESLGRIEAVGRGEGVEGGLAPERRVGARVQLGMQLRLSGKEFSQRCGGEGSGVGSMPGFAASRAVTSLAEAGRGRCGTHRVADPDRYRLA